MNGYASRYDVRDWMDKEAFLAAREYPEEDDGAPDPEPRKQFCCVCGYRNGHANGCPEQD